MALKKEYFRQEKGEIARVRTGHGYNIDLMLTTREQALRHAIFQHFISVGRAPNEAEIGVMLDTGREETQDLLESLAEKHALVLTREGNGIWMMHPFSGVSTQYVVEMGGKRYWANCGWDVLGVPVVVGGEATAIVVGNDGKDAVRIHIPGDGSIDGEGVVHFAVPARRFWDDVGYT